MKRTISSLLALSIALAPLGADAAQKQVLAITGEQLAGRVVVRSAERPGGNSTVRIRVDRMQPELRSQLGRGDALEAFMCDEGTASGSRISSVETQDLSAIQENKPLNNAVTPTGFTIRNSLENPITISEIPLINLVNAAPYCISLGLLREIKKGRRKGDFTLSYSIRNSISPPYDYFVITKEIRGNLGDYDPRPGEEFGRATFI